ncbi:MAG: DegT/DnrJ/EryC1/StrS family aminotransferase [Candidatus Brockarchaeota archaeon]|nr:DegT/DnrJ/EryC1/StrS family aminotransferase [Candidatus Brockarchaeota archaeon]
MPGKLAIEGGKPVRTKPFPPRVQMGPEEERAVVEVVRSNALCRLNGTKVKELEKKFPEHMGSKHGIASTSGTSAIHVALGAARLNPGGEVITTPITDTGTVIPILMQNLIPVFADVDPLTCNTTAETIEEAMTDKTVAIIPVHLWGQPCDMDPILELAERNGLWVFEDCAQAHDAQYKGKKVGTMGDMGCFSFQQSKHMTTGDGGMTITDDDELAAAAAAFALKGNYFDVFVGMNYRMTELQGAVALEQLKKLEGVVEKRRRNAERLSGRISDLEGARPPHVIEGAKHVYWLYPLFLKPENLKVDPKRFAEALQAEGAPFVWPKSSEELVYAKPALTQKRVFGDSGCPWACRFYGRERWYGPGLCKTAEATLPNVLTLAMHECFTHDDIDDIAEAIVKVEANYRK